MAMDLDMKKYVTSKVLGTKIVSCDLIYVHVKCLLIMGDRVNLQHENTCPKIVYANLRDWFS